MLTKQNLKNPAEDGEFTKLLQANQRRKTQNFIVFEGGEGSGKTSLIKRIEESLKPTLKEQAVRVTREPGGSKLAEELREEFLELCRSQPDNIEAQLEKVLEARRVHLKELVLPVLIAGDLLLCDRFRMSTLVYQGRVGGILQEQIEASEARILGDCPKPDLTVLLLGDSKIMRERAIARKAGSSAFDEKSEQFYQKVQDAFRQEAAYAQSAGESILILDADDTLDSNCQKAVQKIRAML